MSRFAVNSNSLFLCGTTKGVVAVMDAGTDLNTATYCSNNLKIVAAAVGSKSPSILTSCETVSAAAAAEGMKVYRALEIFGTVIEGETLDKLSQDLLDSQVLANRDGYQVRYLGSNGVNARGGFVIGNNNYLMKLNNMFQWGEYGVKSPEGRTATVWNRYDVRSREAVVDYVAAEVKAKETAIELEKRRKESGEWEARAAEKEEILGHYRRLIEENKELLREKEKGKNRVKEVLEEKMKLIEEQRRVIEEKELEIERLIKCGGVRVEKEDGDRLKEKVGLDYVDDFKAAMDSSWSFCRSDLNKVVVASNRVFFVNLLVAFLILGLFYLRLVV